MSNNDKSTLPPGDDSPIGIGEALSLVGKSPRFTLEHFRRYGPIFSAKIPGSRIFCLAGAEGLRLFYDQENILRFPAASEKLLHTVWARGDDYGLPPIDNPAHQPRKANFLRTTTWARVEDWMGVFDRRLRAAVADWRSREQLAVTPASDRAILSMLSETSFGTPLEGEEGERMVEAIVDNFAVFTALVTIDLPITTYGKARRAADDVLYPWFRKVLDAHRAAPEDYDDAVTTYLAGPDAGNFTDGEILTDFHQYFIGGYGVASAVPLLVYSLATHPAVVARLQAEVAAHRAVFDAPATVESLCRFTYAEAVVREVLRYWPGVPLIPGQAARDIALDGYVIPEGSSVLACLYATCHDGRVFTDPDVFDPDRFSPERDEGAKDVEFAGYQVAFGAGDNGQTHKCAGVWVALTILKLAALRLAESWSWELADPDAKVSLGALPVRLEDGLRLERTSRPAGRAVFVHLLSGSGLGGKHRLGRPDPYVVARVAEAGGTGQEPARQARTCHRSRTAFPLWDYGVCLSLEGLRDPELHLAVCDRDLLRDDPLGEVRIPLAGDGAPARDYELTPGGSVRVAWSVGESIYPA